MPGSTSVCRCTSTAGAAGSVASSPASGTQLYLRLWGVPPVLFAAPTGEGRDRLFARLLGAVTLAPVD